MRSEGWDAVIITGSDPHGSEYPAQRWKQVQYLTGFSGEAGDVVVTADHAGLWTDTRYFIQALSQLEGTTVQLHKTRVSDQVLIPQWLSEYFKDADSAVIAVDGLAVSATFIYDELEQALDDARVEHCIASCPDLLQRLWTDRPPIPQTPIYIADAGESREDKIAWLRGYLEDNGQDAILLSALDEIAWVLNLRASDIEFNPYIISYLYVSTTEVRWFVLKDKVEDPQSEEVFSSLSDVRLDSYFEVENFLRNAGHLRLLVDSATINYDLYRNLSMSPLRLADAASPVRLRKAVKNGFEVEQMRRAHLLDGVAMERFLYWLEKSLDADRVVSEWDASVKLGQYRAQMEGYLGDSFETISAYGPGAALPHYVTPKTGAPLLKPEGLYLCDSGGHYCCGTTDITRTIPLGPVTDLEAEDYTLVLKGHIDLAKAVFPAGTPGCRIDALARAPLWSRRRNFGHGTGHGVGFVSGVHEGPQELRQNLNPQPILPGMIISDEPGIYREALFGVRHENLLLCVEAEESEFGRWLQFEPLTLCHFDTSIIKRELLDTEELKWLDAYNKRVYEALSPLLEPDIAAWLRKKTSV